ncbi:pectate lyase [Actinoplanes sp. NPDC051494]|uniref:pectate lyase n=1 Tax=Actinoplanes sp. NPDC051494 TaxID=3363907 RepID=UPI00379DF530
MTHAEPGRPGGRRRKAALIGGFAAVVVAAGGLTANAFADSTSFSDSFESGSLTDWTKSGGTWSVVTDGSKVLRQDNATSELARQFAGDKSWTDYTVQAKVRPLTLTGSGSAGIVARSTGSSEFERLVLVPGAVRLEEVRGSSSVTVLSTLKLSTAATGWHTLRLDVTGTKVRGYVDGTLVGDATAKLTKGRAGVVTASASASFDDFAVSASGSSTPTATATATASPTKPATASPTKTATASPTKTATASPTKSATASPTASASAAPVATTWPTASKTEKVTATKKITGSFDGGNTRYVGSGDLGGSGQEEGQDAIFDLADGASISNVIIGSPAADGVHCLGTCTLTNVWWEDVGEDAATFKGTSASQTMTVNGGGAMHAADKTFQHNGPGTFVIKNFQATDIGKLYRSCGNCSKQFARHVKVSNVTITAPLKTLVGINPNLGDTAAIDNVTINNSTSKMIICASFEGVTSGEPTEVDTKPNATCTATNIKLN